ncbi:substrate-binding periplasmic protein [Aestuariispira ectoiniformans]|uniref:substrate-binding periplasmic protein n=1 Tax=Aestuariispira ectoiniformans TaxID=2775080 RepID=UPI00223ACFFA|nr:transporter substrate-binding domain-containing protein [Aestuariispira ectoiniformans]
MPSVLTIWRLRFLLAVMAIAAACSYARAADEITIIAQDIEPLVITDQSGAFTGGILVDLLQLVKDQSGQEIRLANKPTKRGLAEYSIGKSKAIVFLINSGLEEHSDQTIPLLPVTRVYVAKASVPFRGLTDATKLKTAVMLGASINALPVEYRPPEENIISVPSVDQMASMLERNRFDAIIGSDLFVYYYLRKMNKKPSYIHEPVPLEKSAIALHLGPATHGNPEWRTFAQALRQALDSPQYRQILHRYLGSFVKALG